ncbi:MAG: M24 family metallopeptidase [Armatimonadota bacterium]
MNRKHEFTTKLSQLRSILEQQKLDGLVISSQANFAWATCGGSSYVSIATEAGVAHLVVTADRCAVICENIEAPRILDEELQELDCPVVSLNWWEASLPTAIDQFVGSADWGSDTGQFGKPSLEPQLMPLRMVLCGQEIVRYHQLGRMTAESMNTACLAVKPGMSEHQVASLLNRELLNHGIVPQVSLIASDERIAKYRHPIPSEKRIEKLVMLVTGARKWGLVVSMTRLVHFGAVPAELRRRHDAVAEVDAAFISHTTAGTPIATVFEAGMKAYQHAGFVDEWHHHHQGGPTGYKAREFRGSLSVAGEVKTGQVYAWNPSIAGTKSEDTVVITSDGPQVISAITGWPMCATQSVARPDILVR